jgi:hypothetical protein
MALHPVVLHDLLDLEVQVARAWCQIQPTIMKLCTRIRCPASSCMYATPCFRQGRPRYGMRGERRRG